MPPLKFMSFPSLVQENVLKHMEFVEVFMMSLCSKRTKNCAVRARIEIPQVYFTVKETEQKIGIRLGEGKEVTKTIIRVLEYLEERIKSADKVKYGDFESVCAAIKPYKGACVIQIKQTEETFMAGLYHYFKALFRLTEPSYLVMNVNRLSERMLFVEDVNKAYITGQTLEVKNLELFLTKHPNLEVLKIESSINGELDDISRILSVKNLRLSNAGHFGMRVLSNFTGRNICLFESVLVETELNAIIKKWINGEEFQNLEAVLAQNIRPTLKDSIQQIDHNTFNLIKNYSDIVANLTVLVVHSVMMSSEKVMERELRF
ncbi:hypothetical protein GCK72_015258 [Caenorhabditis remanei]|uniref:F-box domain-containing protein n=1 Tax=Caenorhabditis remanei TaxID=31234 RepID=A0A6A5GTK5_CAERE|nr:hypothetical protein GCK72_015258 [Caenorhabditis remanei]KAF1758798.1 hypothetical protein GCK72_015258 [Caenorhabditis remanei]